MELSLLFSIDNNFQSQLLTTLTSIAYNNPKHSFVVYVLQKERLSQTDKIASFCEVLDMDYQPIIMDDDRFEDAPIRKHWSEAMYYRLLAQEYLPRSLDKILYLDADILCINDLTPLFDLDLSDYLYGAASHGKLAQNITVPFNKVRLGNYEVDSYFNSGILIMNLNRLRAEVSSQDIMDYIQDNKLTIMLPDQDVINGLYGDKTLEIPDEKYNFDTRYGFIYEFISNGQVTADWVIENTVFLHYCGKTKPWEENSRSKLSLLYKHYQHLTTKIIANI